MTRRPSSIVSILSAQDGAAAPLVALSIFGLIGAGVLAFDYSRIVTMDTELQNAADHAALAAATQLQDGGTCDLPTQAAEELVANETRLSTDGEPLIAVESVVCGDGIVTVTVAAREVNYTLMEGSGETRASARAGIAGAICKVPPLMMCNPAEAAGGDFDLSAYEGVGILAKAGGGGAWAPGNFGFLEVGASPSASNLRDIFGREGTNFECVAETGVTTAPGNMTAVSTAINTRFDIYENGWAANCGGGDCPSALNVSKDLVKAGNSCSLGNNGWRQLTAAEQYAPDPVTRQDTNVQAMGHPRDICHAVSENGDCAEGMVGDGNWDRVKYFEVNHPTIPASQWQAELGTAPTRWEVYQWEMNGHLQARAVTGGFTSHKAPVCSPGQGASEQSVDRRKVSIAVINCVEQSVNGHSVNVDTLKWMDAFLVEPSINRATNRTNADEIYLEVIGETLVAGNGNQGQLVRRRIPYLIE